MLSYVEGEEFHGTQAKAQLVRNPKNTVAYFKDFVGKEYVIPPAIPSHILTRSQLQVDRPHSLPRLCPRR